MDEIDEQTGSQLLGLARRAIASVVNGASIQNDADFPPSLPGAGVFVTLRKQGALRGCIGTFYPTGDLTATIQEIAVAATRDPRFRHLPIATSELSEIRIELSILSELTRIEDPLDFELGHHGIHLLHGNHTGCFLPDVATEAGWDKEKFLSELCRQKAGLSPDAWRESAVEVSVFTVQKFHE